MLFKHVSLGVLQQPILLLVTGFLDPTTIRCLERACRPLDSQPLLGQLFFHMRSSTDENRHHTLEWALQLIRPFETRFNREKAADPRLETHLTQCETAFNNIIHQLPSDTTEPLSPDVQRELAWLFNYRKTNLSKWVTSLDFTQARFFATFSETLDHTPLHDYIANNPALINASEQCETLLSEPLLSPEQQQSFITLIQRNPLLCLGSRLLRIITKQEDYHEIVSTFLNNGSYMHLRNSTGSLLHNAAVKNHQDTAKLLIGASANVHSRNNIGATPLDHARSHNHSEIAQQLVAAGATPSSDLDLTGQAFFSEH